MYWKFDPFWFFIGILLLVVGILIVRFHQRIADSLASGVSSYGKTKIFGLVVCGVGFLFITNLHTTLVRLIMHLILPNKF